MALRAGQCERLESIVFSKRRHQLSCLTGVGHEQGSSKSSSHLLGDLHFGGRTSLSCMDVSAVFVRPWSSPPRSNGNYPQQKGRLFSRPLEIER